MKSESRESGRGRPSRREVLATLDEEVALLHRSLGGLPRAVEADSILREIWIDDVHNSTAIEGNTMTRAQVADLVDRRRASASIVEVLEVEGYARAADWVYREAPEAQGVSVATISQIHRLALGPIWEVDPPATRDRPGTWRESGVALRGVRVSLPSAIPGDLDSWAASTLDRADQHPVTHSAVHHAWFERIHPFTDGNGRVGRLLLNYMLIQEGYPPAVILRAQRNGYLSALRRADGGAPDALTEVIARAVRNALSRFLIPKLAGEVKLVPLSALESQGFYSADYLRQLAISGRLRAVREGRLWLSSKSWVEDYIRTRDPRGGPVPRRSTGRRRR